MSDLLLEDAMIGCIILKPSIFKDIKASSDDFEDPKNRKIYEIMARFAEDGVDIEPVGIAREMKDNSLVPYLINLNDQILTYKIYPDLDRQIRERAAKKKADFLAQRLIKMAKNGSSGQELVNFAQDIVKELTAKVEGKQGLSILLENWIDSNSGTFYVTECDKELGIVTDRDRNNRRQVLSRLVRKGRIVRASQRQGHYRIVDDSLETIDYKAVISTEPFKIKWPFSIENLVTLLPKSIAIVAGSWESGKTAFLLNVARLNMDKHQVRYMSSEMGDAEFKLRLNLFVDMAPDDWHIEAIERSADWEDAILPDGINIIDYLELSDAFYNVGEKIRKIFDRLKGGIAIIAIQKAIGKDLGRGGDFTAEKARLYLSLDPGELTIVKGKLWASPQVSPKNMTMKFKLWHGHKFVAQGDWFKKIK